MLFPFLIHSALKPHENQITLRLFLNRIQKGKTHTGFISDAHSIPRRHIAFANVEQLKAQLVLS